jgi:putative tryptophan/tyrosine transport system substrate-binding protein
MRRRDFIGLFCLTVSWPLTAAAQQSEMPVIALLHLTSFEAREAYIVDFKSGLAEIGFVEGKNVAIEYRSAQGQNDRWPILMSELIGLKVSAIVVLESTAGSLAAKAATQTIPVVFITGRGPSSNRLGDEPRSSGRKRHRYQRFLGGTRGKAVWIAVRIDTFGEVDRLSLQSHQSSFRRV